MNKSTYAGTSFIISMEKFGRNNNNNNNIFKEIKPGGRDALL